MTNRPNIAVLTDSFASYSGFIGRDTPSLTILPNCIQIGSQRYRENLDLNNEDLLSLLRQANHAPQVTPPSVTDYVEAFTRIAKTADGIISIHASKEISPSWANAQAGARQVSHCPITVLDSRTISASQAMLVRLALELAASGLGLEEIARAMRSAVDRTYCIYYVENTTFAFENRIIKPAHAILGTMVGVKPVLTVENGHLAAMEKVKTRAQAVERLVEFALEFAEVADTVILQSKAQSTDTRKLLLERLKVECPQRAFPTAIYGASLAALIGTDAVGLAVFEKEMDMANGI
ncbi:MAG: DegV family EDD domain-containing protein [Anaerolineae bacterium]|nr:DegV family EDD domain-containing protein [Anaerolineae bacterium]